MSDFTPQQVAAMGKVRSWFTSRTRRPVFQLSGYAGIGKTTLAAQLADDLGLTPYYCAPTGKAASVLARMGCEGATTLHRLIYKVAGSGSQERIEQVINDLKIETDSRLRQTLKRELDQLRTPGFKVNPNSPLAAGTGLVVLDEASMVDTRMARDLLSFHVPVLALGDPAQLQPVSAKSFFGKSPDVLLTEIHRSEADSPVTHFATQVRRQGYMSGRCGNSGVRYDFPSRLKTKSLLAFDQIITHTNRRRHEINTRIREHYGRDPHRPVWGDRVMCLRNDHDLGILNGEQYHVLAVKDLGAHWLLTLRVHGTTERLHVPAAKQTFYDEDLQPRGIGAFTWGYATTGHKAQGSQWPRVLVLPESYSRTVSGWYYTAITRASERVVVVVPPR